MQAVARALQKSFVMDNSGRSQGLGISKCYGLMKLEWIRAYTRISEAGRDFSRKFTPGNKWRKWLCYGGFYTICAMFSRNGRSESGVSGRRELAGFLGKGLRFGGGTGRIGRTFLKESVRGEAQGSAGR